MGNKYANLVGKIVDVMIDSEKTVGIISETLSECIRVTTIKRSEWFDVKDIAALNPFLSIELTGECVAAGRATNSIHLFVPTIGCKASVISDTVDHPSHYTSGAIEVIDIIESVVKSMNLTMFESFLTGNVLKYICRWKNKNGVEDLKKARWYLGRLIEEVGKK